VAAARVTIKAVVVRRMAKASISSSHVNRFQSVRSDHPSPAKASWN
jgi:hypothetical protein